MEKDHKGAKKSGKTGEIQTQKAVAGHGAAGRSRRPRGVGGKSATSASDRLKAKEEEYRLAAIGSWNAQLLSLQVFVFCLSNHSQFVARHRP